jgi:hypothetical protein
MLDRELLAEEGLVPAAVLLLQELADLGRLLGAASTVIPSDEQKAAIQGEHTEE